MAADQELTPAQARRLLTVEAANLLHLADVQLTLTVELGPTPVTVHQAATLAPGVVILLDRLAGESFSVRANGHPFAMGDIICRNDRMGCRINRIILPRPSAAIQAFTDKLLDDTVALPSPSQAEAPPAVDGTVAIPAEVVAMGDGST